MTTHKFVDSMPTVGLDFLWLELTAHCNERCVHCYAESGSDPSTPEVLSPVQYRSLIKQASDLGCKKIQFIGGEPTLHPHLSDFIGYASQCGYDFIEVFTNLYNLSESLLETFKSFDVHVATSFYSFDERRHESVTQTKNSYQRNVTNIQRIINSGLDLRVGVIEMRQNSRDSGETSEFLQSLGVENIGSDRLRSFGRGINQAEEKANDLKELCGNCWSGSLNIRPDGLVSPCIMSRNMPVGNVIDSELKTLIESLELKKLRETIYRDVWLPVVEREKTDSLEIENNCGPCRPHDPSCHPICEPRCSPRCSPSCNPCSPGRQCWPTQCAP